MKKNLLIITETILITQLVLSVVSIAFPMFLNVLWEGFAYVLYAIAWLFPYGMWLIVSAACIFFGDPDWPLALVLYFGLLLVTVAFIFLSYKAKRLWVHRIFKWVVCFLLGSEVVIVMLQFFDSGFHAWISLVEAIVSIAILIMVTIALDRNEGTPLNKPIDLSRL